jgi:hypothetical protein
MVPQIEDYINLSNGRWMLKKHIIAGDLLQYLADFIKKYVVISTAQLIIISLWVVHTYLIDYAETTPYLNIYSPEKRSGKTRLLEVLELLANNPWLTGRVTTAVLARKIDKEHPTLLLDESDTAFKGEKEYSQTLRGILNSGYRCTGKSSICIGQGANIGYKDLSTFCPKAIAGIGSLPDTIADRSIPIELRRRSKNETISSFRLKDVGQEATIMKEYIIRWVSKLKLSDKKPAVPEQLNDRAADCLEPLFVIADAAGGEWPEKARKSALELVTGGARDDESLGIHLLNDIKKVLDPSNQLFSADLADALNKIEESPWGDLDGRPLDNRKLASLLKPYGIHPSNIRKDDLVKKGYHGTDFQDAWLRYLPENAIPSATSATPASTQLQPEPLIHPLQTTEKSPFVADNSQSYAERNVADVADKSLKTEEKAKIAAPWEQEI